MDQLFVYTSRDVANRLNLPHNQVYSIIRKMRYDDPQFKKSVKKVVNTDLLGRNHPQFLLNPVGYDMVCELINN